LYLRNYEAQISYKIAEMTTALRRRLDSLRQMTVERGCTPGETDAAALAVGRILRRLGDDRERLTEREPPYVVPSQGKRTGRRRQPPHSERIHVGDVIDLHRWCRCGRGHGRFEVLSAIELGHAGMLRCVSCARNNGWLTREDFQDGAARLDG
jgi:hypothetical protein